jgi:hypothetical protein
MMYFVEFYVDWILTCTFVNYSIYYRQNNYGINILIDTKQTNYNIYQ